MIVTLEFYNRDACGAPDRSGEAISMRVERDAVEHILRWYGSHYAGDDYDAKVNGRALGLDHNGELDLGCVEGSTS